MSRSNDSVRVQLPTGLSVVVRRLRSNQAMTNQIVLLHEGCLLMLSSRGNLYSPGLSWLNSRRGKLILIGSMVRLALLEQRRAEVITDILAARELVREANEALGISTIWSEAPGRVSLKLETASRPNGSALSVICGATGSRRLVTLEELQRALERLEGSWPSMDNEQYEELSHLILGERLKKS